MGSVSQKKGRSETRRYPQMPGRTPVEKMRSEKKGSFHKVLGKPHEIQYLPKMILKQSEPTKHLGKKKKRGELENMEVWDTVYTDTRKSAEAFWDAPLVCCSLMLIFIVSP